MCFLQSQVAHKELTSGNYKMLDTPLSSSEKRVVDSYSTDAMFPRTERLMVDRLMKVEEKREGKI